VDRDEALKLLRGGPEGVEEWNRRRSASDVFGDLAGIDLSGAHVNKAGRITGAVLRKAVLSQVNLRGADLTEADLTEADLRGADLLKANLCGATLEGADLRGADLRGADLTEYHYADPDLDFDSRGFLTHSRSVEANLAGARLDKVRLDEADLSKARFTGAILTEAVLTGAVLSEADLSEANLTGADLRSADLGGARLYRANLTGAKLGGAKLGGASLWRAVLYGANLTGADLSRASCEGTDFSDVDLSEIEGLDSIRHGGPSPVSTSTLALSKGKIPEAFLRGCGLSPWEVLSARLYDPGLTPPQVNDLTYRIFDAWTKGRSMINGCFISYSWKDAKFVDKLRDRLVKEGVNVWLDRHEMVAGAIQDQVWRAIQLQHVVILVLSKDSVESDWVENELDIAHQRERAEKRSILCPIALDDSWKTKVAAKDNPGDRFRALWRQLTAMLIVDFSDEGAFDEAFGKLLRGLKVWPTLPPPAP
jgi:uncharacterized protein YjbI with pentapeptide repeats